MMKRPQILRMVLSALFLALGLVLPFLTGQIQQFGSMLLPMHLPVLICGFVCGWPWGLAVGFVTPLLRSLLFGMPPMIPSALAMAFELGAYGAFAGLLYEKLPRKKGSIYLALIGAMVLGRIVWGVASLAVYGFLTEKVFTMAIFWASGFANAWPGIVLQLILVPLIVLALERAKFIPIKDR